MPIPEAQAKVFITRLQAAFTQTYDQSQKMLDEAFDAGFRAGKAQAEREMGEKLAQVFGFSSPALPSLQIDPAEESHITNAETRVERHKSRRVRARRGTVKPTIVAALREEHGVKPAEIAAKTGINENTVRGALNKLLAEKVTVKQGDRWFLVAP